MSDAKDLARRVKKFYYSRATLCELLIKGAVNVEGSDIRMPPADFDPFSNFYIDAYVLGCAVIDGLASIWESLGQYQSSGNKDRFIEFLIRLDNRNQMERVCTPFLVFFTKRQKIELPFVREVTAKWLTNRRERESHRVYDDPTVSDLMALYESCHRQFPIPATLTLEKPKTAFSSFTYAALVYKFYRCSFVHEFRSSRFAAHFNTGNAISVREFAASISPSGVGTKVVEVKPQLDIGIGVLTGVIRGGADAVSDVIEDNQITELPYSSTDEITLKVKHNTGSRTK